MWPFEKPFGANLIQDHFSFRHKAYLKLMGYPFIWSRGELVLRHLQPQDGDHILDIGCGVGLFVSEFAARGAQVTGLDIERQNIAIEVPQNPFVRRRVSFVCADAVSLPFRDGTFGKITMVECLEHIKEDGKALSEIRRVLSPKGIVVITVPTYPGYPPHRVFARVIPLLPQRLLRRAARDSQKRVLTYSEDPDSVVLAKADTNEMLKAFGHVRHYTQESLISLLREHGFNILHVKQFQKLFESEMIAFNLGVRGFQRPLLYPFMRAVALLDHCLPRSYPGVELLVVASKT